MTVKQAIVAELGDAALLAPDRIARSLIANDQVKYYFALLQAARANADRPQPRPMNLRAERQASNLADSWLDDVVAAARRDDDGGYLIANGGDILRRIVSAVADMLACLDDSIVQPLAARLAALTPPIGGDVVPGALIDAITSGDRAAGDSLHILVMDAHRAINQLQAATATDTVDGARVHGLSDLGRQRVAAFMHGLNRTAPLKFDHPGLDTTATEHDGRLLIQNDIGTTDAHVLVLRVTGLQAVLTYTDVHRQRLLFFKSLFDGHGVAWEDLSERHSDQLREADYILATGTFVAADEDALQRYLDHLGSRIVFLIDWNRMRKRLRGFVSKKSAITVLKWAADHDYGHRALLEVGGEAALASAVEYAAGRQLRYGQRLDGMIGEDRAVQFLQDALRLAALGLRQRRSRRNIGDELKARLRFYFDSARLGIFDIAAAHAALGYDLALGLCEALERLQTPQGQAWTAGFAARAMAWEAQADHLLNDARQDVKQFERPRTLLAFFERADDAVDELEEAAALLELAAGLPLSAVFVADVRALTDLALASAQELVRCVECAASITRADVRDDLDEFMQALEQLIAVEHAADTAQRAARRTLVLTPAADPSQALLLRDLSQALEQATDAHAHAGQMLRAYLLEEVMR